MLHLAHNKYYIYCWSHYSVQNHSPYLRILKAFGRTFAQDMMELFITDAHSGQEKISRSTKIPKKMSYENINQISN